MQQLSTHYIGEQSKCVFISFLVGKLFPDIGFEATILKNLNSKRPSPVPLEGLTVWPSWERSFPGLDDQPGGQPRPIFSGEDNLGAVYRSLRCPTESEPRFQPKPQCPTAAAEQFFEGFEHRRNENLVAGIAVVTSHLLQGSPSFIQPGQKSWCQPEIPCWEFL